MSIDTTGYQKFSYIKNNGVDKYLIENFLLPGLAVQARLGKKTRGIPLPTPFGQPVELMDINDASKIIISWLEDNNHLYDKDKTKLLNLLNKINSKTGKFRDLIEYLSEDEVQGYEQFANITNEIYQSRVEDPNKLFTTSRLNNLEAYRAAQKTSSTTSRPKFDPGRAIDDYNKLYTEILRYANSPSSARYFSRILPRGIPMGSGDLTKQVLAQIIIHNLTELRSAAKAHPDDPAGASHAVSQKLGYIIRDSYLEEAGPYLNLLGDQGVSQDLNQLTESIETELAANNIKIQELEELKIKALASVDDVIATEAEIYQQVSMSRLPLNKQEKAKLAKTIIQTIASSSGKALSSEEIIKRAAETLKIEESSFAAIKEELNKTGLAYAIEYRQNELHILVENNHLTRGEINLLSQGINPFNTHIKNKETLDKATKKILDEYQIETGTRFNTLTEAINHELSQEPTTKESLSRHTNWSRKLRSHLDQEISYTILDENERKLVGRTRFGRQFLEFRSRVYELQSKFFDKWVDLEETITGKRWLNRQLNKWDTFAENFKVGKAQIPIFRLRNWVFDQLDKWKERTTVNLITRAKSGGELRGLRKTWVWILEKYKQGNFTVSGASFEAFRSSWGGVTKWATLQSGKFASAVAVKIGIKGSVQSMSVLVGRAGTRMLLKLGGRALAKFGVKAAAALAGIAGGISSGIGIVLAASMIWDLLKLGWVFVKELFQNSSFRKTVLGWTTAIAAVFTASNLLRLFTLIGVFFGGVIATTLGYLMLALVIIGIYTFIGTHTYNNIQTTARLDVNLSLDSGIGGIIGNILCDSGEGGGGNSRAQTAACIVEILSKCGINPLTAGNAQGNSWQCVLASTLAQSAIAELQRSATSYSVLQCVGFIVAVDVATGGSGAGFGNANSLASSPPSGYRFAAGVGSCSPGDFFVDISGAWGHTGVFVGNAGAVIKCLDANGGGPGLVRGSDSCVWPSAKVAGCLKKN